MSRPDDRVLVEEVLRGNHGAFAELVDRHQTSLFNTALRMTGDYEEARDLTQEVFIKAYNNMKTFRPEHRFFSWIYRMLINSTLNSLKKSQRQTALKMEVVSKDMLPDEEFNRLRLSQRIDCALMELTFNSRIVIVLRHFNDMSYDEMSDALALPLKTVKSRLYSARQTLANILEREGVPSW